MDRRAPEPGFKPGFKPNAASLQVAVGQHTEAGRKPVNQDFHGLCVPGEPLLGAKGVAVALADGISSSQVSHIASETAVASFLEDYYCTPETWSVKKSAHKVLSAANSWLHAQTRQRHHPDQPRDADRGYVCTMTVMVLKATTAHILHIGDARIYRLRAGTMEQLTDDHRVWISQDKSYLGRALGLTPHLEIDYHTQPLEAGDVFLLATDGVYEHINADDVAQAIAAHPDTLDAAAHSLARLAFDRGSDDNLTVQIVRVEALPARRADEIARYSLNLPCPPLLAAGMEFEGFRIQDELQASHRSHVYLAEDIDSGDKVVIKIPSLDLRHDPAYLERLLTEEWIARRIDSRHVVRAWPMPRTRRTLYTVSEYLPGRTLTRWMAEHPRPTLDQAVTLIEQIARGLQAFHRLEIVHQDLRPDNILIDDDGVARIIDLGSTQAAGLWDGATQDDDAPSMLGTAQYAAPEYFLGEAGTSRSDLYSLAAMLYQMLSGRLPYGADVARARSRAAQMRLTYVSVLDRDRELPAWIDGVLSPALHPDPALRTAELSEFTHALRHPPEATRRGERLPLLERNPLAFWKGLSLVLFAIVIFLLLDR
ncbi:MULTISPECIES: bifunctional protein-serine/threonine kinase/phosphatase [Achromobacter]|uniref:Bifunctional protein-serine/threonine kinase/phosphatase n=1 Tax=Achromobacter spanius TaxID=217203 RepID=A0ABY8H2Y8_9BURK|nr:MULTISPECIES: bifunctional protein-serine/threonine kinase/phosphatase [Achromobacter]WAI86389.1 bifunctional protein-serine/threonine kinase/phosphatase [Achromobacter spanius]WEX97384.1 bifunctional protein-serine/threonine kinase/phosphatase [Achromobacter sp. SS2-2022]WFP11059.1 bifunctional protein-serine/threonine kinase/phosphatase [Achromobacter spanius]